MILILVGIPASGKSTFAKDFIEKNPNYIRINRDDIRKMIRNLPMLDSRGEKLVTDIEYSIAENAIEKGFNIIWDNTHLKMSYINSIIDRFNSKSDILFNVFDIDVEVAIERDNNREAKVGEDIIRKMYDNYINLVRSNELTYLPKKQEEF
jgi:predicted kinase